MGQLFSKKRSNRPVNVAFEVEVFEDFSWKEEPQMTTGHMFGIAWGDSIKDIETDKDGFLLPQSEAYGIIAAAWSLEGLEQAWKDVHHPEAILGSESELCSAIVKLPIFGQKTTNRNLYYAMSSDRRGYMSFFWWLPSNYPLRFGEDVTFGSSFPDSKKYRLLSLVKEEDLEVYNWEWGC